MISFAKLIVTEVAVTAGVLLARWAGERLAAMIIDAMDVEGDVDD